MDPSSLFDDECEVSGEDTGDEEVDDDETEEDARFIDDSGGAAATEADMAAARQLLGVQRGASADEVTREFRKRAKETHPDKDASQGADRRFTDLIEARDLLQSQSNKKRRVEPEEPRAHVPFSDRGLTIWHADVKLESLRARQRIRVRGTVLLDPSGVHKEEVYNVMIPPGAEDGAELCRLLAKGNYSAEAEEREPLVIRLRVMPNDIGATRVGCNIEAPFVMRLEDAMTPEKSVSVELLGTKTAVTIPRNGYWSGDTITVRGKGLPEPGSDELFGDLKLTVAVEKPTQGELREFARKILE